MTLIEKIYESRGKRLLIGGHRGNQSEIRENTIANFEQVRGHVDYIEIDVQLTRDDQAVIYHDMRLEERSQLKGYVRDYTVAELKAAFELNTLDEALAWCKENHLPLLLEIKSVELLMHDTRPMLAERIVESLRRHDMFEDCIVFGIDHRTLKRIKTMEPRTHLALIVPHVPHDPVKLMQEMEAEIYLCYQTNLSVPLVQELQAAGFIVDGSVVNSREQLETALSLGIDMIESDLPFDILAAYSELTGV